MVTGTVPLIHDHFLNAYYVLYTVLEAVDIAINENIDSTILELIVEWMETACQVVIKC